MPITLDELKEEKTRLQDNIYELVNNFEKSTGVSVNELVIRKECVSGCSPMKIVQIEAKVTIV